MYNYIICGAYIDSECRLSAAVEIDFSELPNLYIYHMKRLSNLELLLSRASLSSLVKRNPFTIYDSNDILFVLHHSECIFYGFKKQGIIYFNFNERFYETMVICLSRILHNRYKYIHSAGFVCHDKAFALMASSGTGKSSTLWSLLSKGADYLSDDQLPLFFEKNRYYAMPSSSQSPKFTRETIRYYNMEAENLLQVQNVYYDNLVDTMAVKYYAPLYKIRRCNRKYPLHSIFILCPDDTDEISPVVVKRIKPEIFSKNVANLGFNDFFMDIEKTRSAISYLSRLPSYTHIIELYYRKNFYCLSDLADFILLYIDNNLE